MREGFGFVALVCAVVFALAAPRPLPAQELAELPGLTLVPVDTLRLPSTGLRGIAFRDSTVWLLMSSNEGLSIPEDDYRASILQTGISLGAHDTLLTERGAFETGLAFDGERLIAGGNGVSFGDGVRCCGLSVVRLQIAAASPDGVVGTTVPIALAGGVAPGDTRCYQLWYRDPAGGGACGNSFNFSNAYEVLWAP